MMKIYVYTEQTLRGGQVVVDPDHYLREDGTMSDDIWLWGEGSAEELAAQARQTLADLAKLPDNWPSFFRHAAQQVLAYLGQDD